MHRNRLLPLAAVGAVVFIVAVIAAANLGIDHPGHALVRRLPFGDKLGHAGLFGGLTLIVNLALRGRRLRIGGVPVLVGTVAVVVFVVVEELSQGFVDRRSLDAFDLAADLVGIAVASAVVARIHPDRADAVGASSGGG
ncbi:MAG: VanZ family protein [Actinomycetota bacterium]